MGDTMGGGPTSADERILIILPIPEPKDILQRIRLHYPNAEITYIPRRFENGRVTGDAIPQGELEYDCTQVVPAC
jgi:hypothetical protein